ATVGFGESGRVAVESMASRGRLDVGCLSRHFLGHDAGAAAATAGTERQTIHAGRQIRGRANRDCTGSALAALAAYIPAATAATTTTTAAAQQDLIRPFDEVRAGAARGASWMNRQKALLVQRIRCGVDYREHVLLRIVVGEYTVRRAVLRKHRGARASQEHQCQSATGFHLQSPPVMRVFTSLLHKTYVCATTTGAMCVPEY